MTKKTYKLKNIDCPSCATLIEMELEDLGVKASCSYAKQVLNVEFDERKVKEEEIKDKISNYFIK